MKRLVVIVSSIIVFHTATTAQNIVGMLLALGGFFLYAHVSYADSHPTLTSIPQPVLNTIVVSVFSAHTPQSDQTGRGNLDLNFQSPDKCDQGNNVSPRHALLNSDFADVDSEDEQDELSQGILTRRVYVDDYSSTTTEAHRFI